MPDIEASIWQKYRDKGVLVYGIHGGDLPDQVLDFIAQTGVTFPIVADAQGSLSSFVFPNGVNYPYPRDVVIGKDLVVRSIRNSFNPDEMSSLVEQLLASDSVR